MKIFVSYLLIKYADLIIGLVVDQLTQSVLYISITIYIGFDGIDDTVVGNAAFNYVIPLPWTFALSAINNKVEPFLVVCIKTFDVAVCWKSELEPLTMACVALRIVIVRFAH